MKVKIYDIGVNDHSVLNIGVRDDSGDYGLEFTLPERFVPAPDLIALSMCTLFGQKYDFVDMDLPITRRTKETMSQIMRAEISAAKAPLPQSAPSGKNTTLNFSGGFDSLAAMALLPNNRNLVSLNFGGSFTREFNFFKKFDTSIISTNFRELGFAGNHWTFMGVGTILLRDYLETKNYSFGSILEASPWNFKQTTFNNYAQPVFSAAGMTQFNPVLGLTEVGTVMLLAKQMPELLTESLSSLAAPRSEKLNRKIILLNIVQNLFQDNFGITVVQDNKEPQIVFGQSLATDFLSLYILKKLGRASAESLVGDIPSKVDQFVKQNAMNFYERSNTIFAESWDFTTKAEVSKKLFESGIEPYTERDWIEYRATVQFLSEWHLNLKG